MCVHTYACIYIATGCIYIISTFNYTFLCIFVHISTHMHAHTHIHVLYVHIYLYVLRFPAIVTNNDLVLFKEKFILLGSDVFIDCSVNYGTEYNITSWLLDNEPLLINQTSRFSQNTSGLIIYNVTELDEGNYTCCVNQVQGITLVHIQCKIICRCEKHATVPTYVNVFVQGLQN